jgi:hypothetical protein
MAVLYDSKLGTTLRDDLVSLSGNITFLSRHFQTMVENFSRHFLLEYYCYSVGPACSPTCQHRELAQHASPKLVLCRSILFWSKSSNNSSQHVNQLYELAMMKIAVIVSPS